MNRFLWPLIGFIVLVALLAVGLGLNPRDVPSPLVGKPTPMFSLAQVEAPDKLFSPKDMAGKVWLLNVWSTWCVSCREEHPVLVEMAKSGSVTLIGLNYKEVSGDGSLNADKMTPEAERALALERAREWLHTHGNPYQLSVLDLDGRVGIDFGVYGVPETYVIDKNGLIRMKHTGPISPDIFSSKILPLVAELSK